MNKITEVKIERGIPTLYVDGQPLGVCRGGAQLSRLCPGQDGGRDMDEDGSESSEYTDCTGVLGDAGAGRKAAMIFRLWIHFLSRLLDLRKS